jgi:hypothetical protein
VQLWHPVAYENVLRRLEVDNNPHHVFHHRSVLENMHEYLAQLRKINQILLVCWSKMIGLLN